MTELLVEREQGGVSVYVDLGTRGPVAHSTLHRHSAAPAEGRHLAVVHAYAGGYGRVADPVYIVARGRMTVPDGWTLRQVGIFDAGTMIRPPRRYPRPARMPDVAEMERLAREVFKLDHALLGVR